MPVPRNPSITWFCEFDSGLDDDPDLNIVALRSTRVCDGICSNLVGWYAVRKSSGEVYEYDMGELKVRPMGYYEAMSHPKNSN